MGLSKIHHTCLANIAWLKWMKEWNPSHPSRLDFTKQTPILPMNLRSFFKKAPSKLGHQRFKLPTQA